MNIELLKKVRGAVADEATAFDMSVWGVGISERGRWWPLDTDDDHGVERDVLGDCGAAACIAGWAVKLSRPQKVKVDSLVTQHDIGYFAERLLGSPHGWGSEYGYARGLNNLFNATLWPEWTDTLFERVGAVAMLDLIIAGHNPWDPPEGWVLPT